MKQREHTFNNILIYKHESQTLQLLPAKSHKPYEASQRTPRVTNLKMMAQNPSDYTSDICHPFTYHKPIQIPISRLLSI